LSVDPIFQVEGVDPHQPFFFSETNINALSCGIKIWTDLSTVLSQLTHVTDRQTDRQNSHRYTASAFHAAR